MIRHLRIEDREKLMRIHDEHYAKDFPLPDLQRSIANLVLEQDGRVLGAGFLREILEGIMMVDKDLPKREIIAILDSLIARAQIIADSAGHENFHVFIQDEEFAQILKKHYGFRTAKGEVLVSGDIHGQERRR